MKFPVSSRLLGAVPIEPVQGTRFQPTGFPSLGAAEFTHMTDDDQSIPSLLVESAQSMANRLEAVCWDEGKLALVRPLEGMPVITVTDKDCNFLTNSLLEAHRMNSSYMLEGSDKTLRDTLTTDLKLDDEASAVDKSKLARFALKYDPNSILHGVFLSRKEISGGRYRMTRALSSFIEATNVTPVASGGVKLDHLDPKGGKKDNQDSSEEKSGAKAGFGHIPYSRTEYSAQSITVYFSIDLALIRSYGFPDLANDFLFTLALWKIRSFLEHGMRLRTACDMKIKDQITFTLPESFTLPDLNTLEKDLKVLISKCRKNGLFTTKPLEIKYSKSKKSKKSNG